MPPVAHSQVADSRRQQRRRNELLVEFINYKRASKAALGLRTSSPMTRFPATAATIVVESLTRT
jgi:hypothetical protein